MSVKGGLYMLKVFKNEKLWCAVAGAAAVIVGKKILKADKTRSLAVTGRGSDRTDLCTLPDWNAVFFRSGTGRCR